MKRQTVLLSMLAVALVVVLAAGCGGKAGGGKQATGQEPVKIGVVTSQSGPLESYGTQELRGLKLGIAYATNGTNEVLGRKIDLLVEDDAGDPGKGVQAARKLIEQDKVDVLQGCASSGVALAVEQVAAQYKKIFVVDPAAADSITGKDLNRYTFRTGSSVSQDALAGGKYAVEHLGKKCYQLAPDYSWGKESAAAWKKAIVAAGGTELGEEYAPLNTTDFTPYLQKAIEMKPGVLVVSWAGAGAVKLFEQIKDQGLYNKMKITCGVGDLASLKAMGDAALGFTGMVKYFYTLPKNSVNDWLVKEHEKEYGSSPDLFTAGGFAAGQAIVAAIKQAGGTDTEKMIAALEGMSFESPKGAMTIRKEDHQALQPMYIVKLEKNAALGFPAPVLIKEMSAQETAPSLTVSK